jgi:hypothetical protein
MDLTPLARLKLDSLDPESGRGNKRNRTVMNRCRAFSTTLRKPKGTVFDPKGIEQLDYMDLHTIT